MEEVGSGSCPIVGFSSSGLELRIVFVNSFRAALILLCLIYGKIYSNPNRLNLYVSGN
jgi:hypothetical protein